MKKTLLLFTVTILFLSCNSQSKEDEISRLNNSPAIADSLQSWLTEGYYVADIMNAYSPRATFLSEKMAAGIAQNQEWYFSFMKTIPAGEKMPYHENLGLTLEEYTEMMLLFDDLEVYSSGQERLNVKYSGDTILFESSDPTLQSLNFITINIKTNTVKFTVPDQGEMTLSYNREIDVISDSNAFKSAWHGYAWVYESGIKNQDFNEVKNISDIDDFIKFELMLGIRDKDNRIFFDLTLQSMANGEVIASNDLPLLIQKSSTQSMGLQSPLITTELIETTPCKICLIENELNKIEAQLATHRAIGSTTEIIDSIQHLKNEALVNQDLLYKRYIDENGKLNEAWSDCAYSFKIPKVKFSTIQLEALKEIHAYYNCPRVYELSNYQKKITPDKNGIYNLKNRGKSYSLTKNQLKKFINRKEKEYININNYLKSKTVDACNKYSNREEDSFPDSYILILRDYSFEVMKKFDLETEVCSIYDNDKKMQKLIENYNKIPNQ